MFAALQANCLSPQPHKKFKCVSFADDYGKPLETMIPRPSNEDNSDDEEPAKQSIDNVDSSPVNMEEFPNIVEEESKAKRRQPLSAVLCSHTTGMNPLDAAIYSLWTASSSIHATPTGFGIFHNHSSHLHKPLHR